IYVDHFIYTAVVHGVVDGNEGGARSLDKGCRGHQPATSEGLEAQGNGP
ncbi:MAG: hypothetical protein RL205_278, partial [Actinomycetota bacterium]